MSLCENCVKGFTHEGTATGTFATINGVKCYIATPSEEFPKEKALLFLPDLFGPYLINSQLLADDFAKNGFKTVIPDYFDGDAAPLEALDPDYTFDRWEWAKRHGPEVTRPILEKVVEGLKTEGVISLAAAGYCFGGRYAFDLAFDGIVEAVMVAHPAQLKIPDDLEIYFNKSTAPLLINSCTHDPLFTREAQLKADEIFKDKFAPGYRHEHWVNCSHGFASRGDVSVPDVKAGKEGAFKATVQWMWKHFYGRQCEGV